MTIVEAKEIVISAMNYAAYREFECSLYVADRNQLFGEEHFSLEPNTTPADRPSPWQGAQFEEKMAELLAIGSNLTEREQFRKAIGTLLAGDNYLNRIIRKARKSHMWKG